MKAQQWKIIIFARSSAQVKHAQFRTDDEPYGTGDARSIPLPPLLRDPAVIRSEGTQFIFKII